MSTKNKNLIDGFPVPYTLTQQQEIHMTALLRPPLVVEDDLEVSRIMVTPEMAKEWLDTSVNYRKIRPNRVIALSRDMESGNFANNGATIRVGTNGCLLDGHHRCTACVDTGIPFDAFVVTGVDPAQAGNMDNGLPRSFSDYMSHKDVPYASMMAAAVRLCIGYGTGLVSEMRTPSATHVEMASYFRENGEIVGFGKFCASTGGLLRASVGTMIIKCAGEVLRNEAKQFIASVNTGKNLSDESAAFLLRKRFLTAKKGPPLESRKINSAEMSLLSIHAFNCDMTGRTIKTLKMPRMANGVLRFVAIIDADDVL